MENNTFNPQPLTKEELAFYDSTGELPPLRASTDERRVGTGQPDGMAFNPVPATAEEVASWEEDQATTQRIKNQHTAAIERNLSGVPVAIGPIEFDTTWSELLGNDFTAGLVGVGHGMVDTYRGVRQWLGIDVAEEQANERIWNELVADEEYGTEATVGEIVGFVADPAGLVPGTAIARGGRALIAGTRLSREVDATIDAARVAQRVAPEIARGAAMGAGAGAAWGAAGYTDKEAGETTLGNAVQGALFGTALGVLPGAVRSVRSLTAHSDAVRKAEAFNIEIVDRVKQHENILDEGEPEDFLEVVARLGGDDEKLYQHYKNDSWEGLPLPVQMKFAMMEIKEEMPELFNDVLAIKNSQILGEDFPNPRVYFDAEEMLQTSDIPLDTIKPSESNALFNAVDKMLGLVSTRVKNISPKMFSRLRSFEANLKIRPQEMMRETQGWADYFNPAPGSGRHTTIPAKERWTKEQTEEINYLLMNGKFDEAMDFVEQNKGGKVAAELRKTLDRLEKLRPELDAANVVGEFVEHFYPRRIDPAKRDDFLDFLSTKGNVKNKWNEHLSSLNENLQATRGYGLSALEESNEFESWIGKQAFKTASDDVSKVDVGMGRKIPTIPREWVQFYQDPIASLHSYFKRVVKEIETSKLIGSESYKAGLDNGVFDASKAVAHLRGVKEGAYADVFSGLDAMDSKELFELITLRLGRATRSTPEALQWYKGLVNMTLLANPISALTQLGDLGVAMYKNGTMRTLKAVADKVLSKEGRVTVEELGLDLTRFAEFEDVTLPGLKKTQNFMFKWSGFKMMDELGKEAFVNGALSKAVKIIKDPTSAAYRKWANEQRALLQPNQFAQLTKDLKAYAASPTKENITDEMRVYLVNKLADIQPIHLSDLPQGYHHPVGRVLFTLKSFVLKQYDILRNDAYAKMRSGAKMIKDGDKLEGTKRFSEGFVNLQRYALAVGVMNIGVDKAKDLVLGREDLDGMPEPAQRQAFSSYWLASPWSKTLEVMGFSRFAKWQVQRHGAVEGAVLSQLPPLPVVKELGQFVYDALAKDKLSYRHMERIQNYVPIIGRFLSKGRVVESGTRGESLELKDVMPFTDEAKDEGKAATRNLYESNNTVFDVDGGGVGLFAEGGAVVKPESTSDIQKKLDQGVSPHELSVHRGNADDVLPTAAKGVLPQATALDSKRQRMPVSGSNLERLQPGTYQDEEGTLFTVGEDGSVSPLLPTDDKRQRMTDGERYYLNLHYNELSGGGVENSDGSVSTVRGSVMGGEDGREYLIPTVRDGKILSEEEAWERANEDGLEKYPSYGSVEEALEAEERLKEEINASTKAVRKGGGKPTHTPEESFGQDKPIATGGEVYKEMGEWLKEDAQNGWEMAKKLAPSLIPFNDARMAMARGDGEEVVKEVLWEGLGAVGDVARFGGAMVGSIVSASKMQTKAYEEALASGKSEKSIFTSLSLFKGEDGELRKLIIPKKFSVKMDAIKKGETLDKVYAGGHWGEVFKAVPESKKVRVSVWDEAALLDAGANTKDLEEVAAFFDPVEKRIYVNPVIADLGDSEELQRVLLHETQHALQWLGGLSIGRGSRAFEHLLSKDEYAEYLRLSARKEEIAQAQTPSLSVEESSLSVEEWAELSKEDEYITQFINAFENEAYLRYRAALGEAEGRYVEGLYVGKESGEALPSKGIRSMLEREGDYEPWDSRSLLQPPQAQPKQYSGQVPEDVDWKDAENINVQ